MLSDEQRSANMDVWNALRTPPAAALKKIEAGRLKGKSDINPQWRMQALTEQFGPCGFGWSYTIDKHEVITLPSGEVVLLAWVTLCVKRGDEWSRPIPGVGGNMLVEQERNGLHVNDEALKMAVTDAISVAAKAEGLAADVYLGQIDTKYSRVAEPSYNAPPAAVTRPAAVNLPIPTLPTVAPVHQHEPDGSPADPDGSPSYGDWQQAVNAAVNADVTIKTKKYAAEYPEGIPLALLYMRDTGYVKHWLAEKATGFGHDKAVQFLDSLPAWALSYPENVVDIHKPAAAPPTAPRVGNTLLVLADLLKQLNKSDADVAAIIEGNHTQDWIDRQCHNAINALAAQGSLEDDLSIPF